MMIIASRGHSYAMSCIITFQPYSECAQEDGSGGCPVILGTSHDATEHSLVGTYDKHICVYDVQEVETEQNFFITCSCDLQEPIVFPSFIL